MKSLIIGSFLILLLAIPVKAQLNYNANDEVPVYDRPYLFGSGLGDFRPWTEKMMGDIGVGNANKNIEGIGIRTFRWTLRESFLEPYGYESLLDECRYLDSLGAKDMTVFVGYPIDEHKDPAVYGENESASLLFANLYEPIWDNGENGTPVNENNYYASYLYKTVSLYKDYVRFWEIVNEPDLDYGSFGWRTPGLDNNWWDNDPQPSHLPNLRAPLYHYIRMLRISYEIIKTVDPEAYVAVGGIGYPSFLDAILRNTDNPDDGEVSEDFPYFGGAYFDVVSYHEYPHHGLRRWNNSIGDFDYFRHSDAAANKVISKKHEFTDVLHKYGYDGQKYPGKLFIITESNYPRKGFSHEEGWFSVEAQRNFIMKALIQTIVEDIKQFYVYTIADTRDESEASNAYQLMGLFKNLKTSEFYKEELNESGIGYKTTSSILFGKNYDAIMTDSILQGRNDVAGAAFTDNDGNLSVALWGKTHTDLSEDVSVDFSFPNAFQNYHIIQKQWDHSVTKTMTKAGENVKLTSTPAFFEIALNEEVEGPEGSGFIIYPNPIGKGNQANLVFSSPVEDEFDFSIFSIQGRLIKKLMEKKRIQSGDYKLIFDTADLSNGTYIGILSYGSRLESTRFVVAR